MTNHSETQEARLKSLLTLEDNSQKTGALRQQEIIQGVRWLATLQEFIRLYLAILPSLFINILSTIVKPNKDNKNGN